MILEILCFDWGTSSCEEDERLSAKLIRFEGQ